MLLGAAGSGRAGALPPTGEPLGLAAALVEAHWGVWRRTSCWLVSGNGVGIGRSGAAWAQMEIISGHKGAWGERASVFAHCLLVGHST